MAKKVAKTTKRSSGKNSYHSDNGLDQDLIIIVGGGFLLIIIIMMLLGR